MRFSETLVVSSLAASVAAHGAVRGAPKIFGLGPAVKRDDFMGPVLRRAASSPSRHAFTKRQSDNTGGQCGPSAGGASCAEGYCCSESGWCGNTPEYCNAPGCQINFGSGCDANKVPNGDDTRTIARNKLGNQVYGGSGIYECVEPGTVAVTYDDGPYIYTEHVLDLFQQYNMKATFFVTGNNNGKGAIDDASTPWPAILSRTLAEGHQIASHTWSHQDLSAITSAQRIDQMVRNEMAIRNVIQKFPTYMRPPYSSCSEASGCTKDMQDLGYVVTYFDVDTDDYNNLTPNLIQNAKDRFGGFFQNDNVETDAFLAIAHDIHEQTAYNLTAYMLQVIQENGYRGVTVGECLGDPEANWYRASSGQIVSSSSATVSATAASSGAPTATPTAVSTDGRCGDSTGSMCQGSEFGNCCSSAGWCGTSPDHCGTGCQSVFGTCDGASSPGSSTSTSAASPTAVSTNGRCGGSTGSMCQGSEFGNCCSSAGWCGTSPDHCGTGCQSVFGTCDGASSPGSSTSASAASSSAVVSPPSSLVTSVRPTSTTTTPPPAQTSAPSNVSTNGRCGPANGGKTCPGSQCCSLFGHCGTNILFCAVGCRRQYGRCWF